jgi:putative ABC transport system permease protein
MLVVAIGELRASAIRASALAATGALAVFGAVAVGGAHRDLLRGLDDNSASFVGTADVWVTAGGDENGLTSGMFHPRPEQFAALRRSRAVSDVRVYRGGLLDVAGRRVGVVARPRRDPTLLPERQLLEGDLDRATSRLRAGGWIAVSKVVTDDLDLNVGDRMRLPTPSGTRSLRVAATLTNFGWAPGVLVLNADEFRSRWRTDAAAALEIDLRRGVTPEQGKRAVRQAVGGDPALVVETAAERKSRFERLSRQGLERLSQISVLVVIAAILALAAAMGAVLWQRRPRLAQLKLSGFRDVEVWRALLFETSIVLGIGCSIGAATGLLGQALLARALEFATGFPVEYAAAATLALIVLCGIALVATAVTAVPGWVAARVPPVLGLQEE